MKAFDGFDMHFEDADLEKSNYSLQICTQFFALDDLNAVHVRYIHNSSWNLHYNHLERRFQVSILDNREEPSNVCTWEYRTEGCKFGRSKLCD